MGVVGRSFLRLEKIPIDTLVLGANYIWYLEAKIGTFSCKDINRDLLPEGRDPY